MVFTNIILIIVLILNFVFLSMLYKKNNPLIRSFRLVNIGIIIWTFPIFIWPLIKNKSLLFFLGIIAYWGPLLISYSLLKLAYLFPQNSKDIRKAYRVLFFLFFLTAWIITLVPGFVLRGVGDSGYKLDTGKGIYIFFGIIAFFAIAALIILSYKYFKFSGVYRYQLKYLFLGFLISVVVAFVSNAVLALFNIYEYVWLGPSITLFFIGFTSYAITRYRFMGIKVLVSKVYLYTVLAFFVYFFFYFTYLFETQYLGGIFSPESLTFGFLIAVFFSFIFLHLLGYVQKTSDVLFFKGYNPQRIIKDVILRIATVIDLEELIDILALEFKRILNTEEMDVLIFSKNTGALENGKRCARGVKSFKKFELCVDDVLYRKIASRNQIIVRDEISSQDKAILSLLDKHNIKIIAPLISRYRLIGVILLGEKINRVAYTREDIEFLEIMTSQSASALENALLYKEVEDFNRDLKKMVNEQTADIREKTKRLQKLLVMRSEFLDIASHQLRTPVSVIKGVLSMMKEGSVPKEKVAEFINSALEKSFKLEEIIDEILKASEMDSDKFKLDLAPLDLRPILEVIYNDKLEIAKDKGIKFILNLPPKKPLLILSDEKYLRHCLNNLINNSLQYTPQGGKISLSVKLKRSRLNILVKDTGIGIPKKDIGKLFQKFSRAKNAVDMYTDGSGLGLFIVKKIISGHRGAKIYIKKTKVNKGTTMVLSFPILKP